MTDSPVPVPPVTVTVVISPERRGEFMQLVHELHAGRFGA